MNEELFVEKFENDKYLINKYYDSDTTSPRENDNLGTIFGWHSRYDLSDEDHGFSSPREFLEYYAAEYYLSDETLSAASNERLLELLAKTHIVLPLYMLEHGGVALKAYTFNDPWDSGQVGWIIADKEEIRKEYGVKVVSRKTKEKVIEILMAEIEEYSLYLNGEVFIYEINFKETGEVEHVGGLYGFREEDNGILGCVGEDMQRLLLGEDVKIEERIG
jgi:hypothetical protein